MPKKQDPDRLNAILSSSGYAESVDEIRSSIAVWHATRATSIVRP